MLRTTILVGLVAGALAASAAVAMAAGPPDDDSVAATYVTQDQDRVRAQAHDRVMDCDEAEARVRAMDREQLGLDDANGYAHMANRGAVMHESEAAGAHAPGGFGEGVLDGTGPIHDGPRDGTGNQYGVGGS